MDKTYKVSYQGITKPYETMFFDDDLKKAEWFFQKKRNERTLETWWAELIETDWDGDPNQGDVVVKGFIQDKATLFGLEILTGRYNDY